MNSTLDAPRNTSAAEHDQELTPSIEERLNTIKQALGLLIMLSRGLERTDDLQMREEDLCAALEQLGAIIEGAMESLRALKAALPNEVMLLSAPAQNR
jgi:hypothetical protein